MEKPEWEPVLVNGQAVHPAGDGPPPLHRPCGSGPTWWPEPARTEWSAGWTPSPSAVRLRQLADRLICECGHRRSRHSETSRRCVGCPCTHYHRTRRPPGGHHRRFDEWTVADYRSVLDARRAGVTLKTLGRRFGVSKGRMGQIAHKAARLRAAGKLRQLRVVGGLGKAAPIC